MCGASLVKPNIKKKTRTPICQKKKEKKYKMKRGLNDMQRIFFFFILFWMYEI